MLFFVSNVPPVVDTPAARTLPLYVCPPTVTSRSRLLTRAGSDAAGGSVQTSVTLNGFEPSETVPVIVDTWPGAESCTVWSTNSVAVPVFKMFFRLTRPQPSKPLGRAALAKAPVMSVVLLISAALTSAGLGFTPPCPFFQKFTNSAAAPATFGAACDVPSLHR